MIISLITDEIKIHQYNSITSEFVTTNQKSFFTAPNTNNLFICFAEHYSKNNSYSPVIEQALSQNIGIIYICDILPKNLIKNNNIIYLEVGWRWFIHTLFYNPLCFKGIIYNIQNSNLANRLSKAFSCFTKYKIPEIKSEQDFKLLNNQLQVNNKKILFEITGGLGDHIMCLPTFKQFVKNGYEVSVLIPKQYLELFKQQSLIHKVYTNRTDINVADFDDIKHLHFGQVLNDYRLDLNKKNRIISVAEYSGISEDELEDKQPHIEVPLNLVTKFNEKYKEYSNKVFIGWDSNRCDAKLPDHITQNLIDKLNDLGFTVFTASIHKSNFNNCINLVEKLSTLELVALIKTMDYIITVDTSFLHIAGALNIPTLALIHHFVPEWRSSFYPTVKTFTPNINCYPCVSTQFVDLNKRQCLYKSCFEYFNYDEIVNALIKLKEFQANESII